MDHLPRLRLLPHVCTICHLIPFKFEARETGSVLYMSNCIMGLWIMGTVDAIASLLAITKLRWKLGQNSTLKQSHSAVRHKADPVPRETTKFEVARETGSVLCEIASWDCFGDAIASFIGWVKICPPNSPTVQFGTALSKSPPRLHHWTVLGYLFFHCLYDAKLSTKMGQNSSRGRGDKESYGRCANGEWKATGTTKVEDV